MLKRKVDVFKSEVEKVRESMLFKSEKAKVSPLVPLCVFPTMEAKVEKPAQFRYRTSLSIRLLGQRRKG